MASSGIAEHSLYGKCTTKGVYVGQTQANMVDDGPPTFFFKAEMIDGIPCVNGKPVPPLAPEQMLLAEGK